MTVRHNRDQYLQAVRMAKERAKRLPPDQLRDLSDEMSVSSATANLPAPVSVIRERHENSGGVLVVAQAFRPWARWLPRGGNMFVDGFILHPDDQITEPEPKGFVGLHLICGHVKGLGNRWPACVHLKANES